MADLLLACSLLAPVVAIGSAYWFFRVQKKILIDRNWLKLIIGNVLMLIALSATVFAMGEIYFRVIYDATDSFSFTLTSQRWFERHYAYNNWDYRDDVDYTARPHPS